MQTSTRSHTPPRRAGLTLVEVLIALVLVAVGILGVAGASAIALRSATAASLEHRAQRRAEQRLAELTARGCAGPAAGTDSALGLRETWSLDPAANGGALMNDSVAWNADGRARHLALHSALLC